MVRATDFTVTKASPDHFSLTRHAWRAGHTTSVCSVLHTSSGDAEEFVFVHPEHHHRRVMHRPLKQLQLAITRTILRKT